jgi:hypothetical protein
VNDRDRARWRRLGFNLCAACGLLAKCQPGPQADAFFSVAVESPAVVAEVCQCPAPR